MTPIPNLNQTQRNVCEHLSAILDSNDSSKDESNAALEKEAKEAEKDSSGGADDGTQGDGDSNKDMHSD